jgi:hypothetical protein
MDCFGIYPRNDVQNTLFGQPLAGAGFVAVTSLKSPIRLRLASTLKVHYTLLRFLQKTHKT